MRLPVDTTAITLLDMEAVSRWLSTSTRHVRRMVTEKRIPYVKVGHFVRFDAHDLAQWIEERKVADVGVASVADPAWVKHRVGNVGAKAAFTPRASGRQASSSKSSARPWLTNRTA